MYAGQEATVKTGHGTFLSQRIFFSICLILFLYEKMDIHFMMCVSQIIIQYCMSVISQYNLNKNTLKKKSASVFAPSILDLWQKALWMVLTIPPLNEVAAVHQKVAYKLEANHFSAVMGCLLLLSAALSRHSIHLWPIRDGKMSLLQPFRASVSRKKNNEGWTGEVSVPPVKRRCKVPRTTLPLAPAATPHPPPPPVRKD